MAMKLVDNRRKLLCLVGSVVAVLLVALIESANWNRVAEIRRNSQAAASDRFHLAARLEARVRKLNSLYFRFSMGVGTASRADIESETQGFRQFLETEPKGTVTPGEKAELEKFNSDFRKYVEHVRPILSTPLRDTEILDWRREKEALVAAMLAQCSRLREAEQRALERYLADSRADISALERSLITSSILLLGIGAAVALMLYVGVVDPLRRNLQRSRSIIQQQEKLSSLGMLAAGVAHEIRNPLTSIKARLFAQQALLKSGSEEWGDNVFIAEEITRLERIVRDFLAFARPSEPELAPVSGAAALREAADLLGPELNARKVTIREETSGAPVARADAQQLKQVLINLIRNAAESIEGDGVVTLRCRREIRQRTSRPMPFVVLEIQDTGKGMSAEVKQRLFDPFFTTKAAGTGLGLSTAARIIEKHGGMLEYDSELNRGTTFRILLPEHVEHDPIQNPDR